jgi:hypothetical protein
MIHIGQERMACQSDGTTFVGEVDCLLHGVGMGSGNNEGVALVFNRTLCEWPAHTAGADDGLGEPHPRHNVAGDLSGTLIDQPHPADQALDATESGWRIWIDQNDLSAKLNRSNGGTATSRPTADDENVCVLSKFTNDHENRSGCAL